MDKKSTKEDLSERRKESKPQGQHHGKPSSHTAAGSSEPIGARQLLAKARDSTNQSVGSRDSTSSAKFEKLPAAPPAQGSPGSLGQLIFAASGQKMTGDLKSAENVSDRDNIDTAEEKVFVDKIRSFYRSRGTDFKVPKFYGNPVNLLKLWRLVCQHGGYDQVTSGKQWRVVGDHFNPPKSCTTLSWSFRGFYEKSLLDFERVHGVEDFSTTGSAPRAQKLRSDEKRKAAPDGSLPVTGGKPPEKMSAEKDAALQDEASEKKCTVEPGRASTDMDAWRAPATSKKRPSSQRAPSDGGHGKAEDMEVDPAPDGDPEGPAPKKGKKFATDSSARAVQAPPENKPGVHKGGGLPGGGGKQVVALPSAEKPEHPGSSKGKQAKGKKSDVEDASLDTQPAVVWDVGEECSWVKVNVRRSSDCFEIYALVPGLLREEIKVQAEDTGRVVIAGVPEREDNPWGVRKFKKIVILPGAVLAAETKAVVALHGQLYVHLPLVTVPGK